MLLKNKNAIVYGGGGVIGGAVARAFAREGARLFLAGRTRAKLDTVARDISPGPGYMGHSVACAGIEALSRHLAGELAANGIRVACIRSHAIPEAAAMGSHSRDVFRQVAERFGVTIDEMLVGGAQGTLLKRLPKLAEVANTAVFLASEHAGAMTGAVANLTCGMILD